MANYLIKFKDRYRILPVIDRETNDFVKDRNGAIDEDMVYIPCYYGTEIWYYGLNDSRRAVLGSYIPSLGRGRNIKRAMEKSDINFFDYDESDEECTFHFLASDIDVVAPLLKPKTNGAGISPWSTKNLPKSNVEIPTNEVERYKAISSRVDATGIGVIRETNCSFLAHMEKILRKKLKDKKFTCLEDVRKLKMSRQFKEYVWTRGFWDEYLNYLDKAITDYYNNK